MARSVKSWLLLAAIALAAAAKPLLALAWPATGPAQELRAGVVHEAAGEPRHDARHAHGTSAGSHADLPCGHAAGCALPAARLQALVQEPAVRAATVGSLSELFFPERPQRPPLA